MTAVQWALAFALWFVAVAAVLAVLSINDLEDQ